MVTQDHRGRFGTGPLEVRVTERRTRRRRWPRAGRGLVLCGGVHKSKLSVTEPLLVSGAARQVDRDGLGHGRVVNALSHTLPVRVGRDGLAECGPVVWRMGRVPMRPEV
jgi:hypothetical protein